MNLENLKQIRDKLIYINLLLDILTLFKISWRVIDEMNHQFVDLTWFWFLSLIYPVLKRDRVNES